MKIVSELEKIVGPDRVSTSEAVCLTYSYGCFIGKRVVRKPDIVVMPQTPEEVSEIIRAANRHNVPVTPKGATGAGGHTGPLRGGILLDMSLMDRIIRIDVDDMKAVAEAGCSFFKLAQELFKQDLMLPTSEYGPGPNVAASVTVPVNAFGKTRYGRNIDLVEGLEVVLPSGKIIRVGSMAYLDSDFGPYYRYITGPDLIGLWAKSNGAFGIITKVAYQCLRRPKFWAFHSYYWPLEKIEDVTKVLMEATALEMFDIHINDKWKYAATDYGSEKPMLPEDCYFIVIFTVNAENEQELKGKEQSVTDICMTYGGTYLQGIAEDFFAEWPTMFNPVSNPNFAKLLSVSRDVLGSTYMYLYDSPNYPISKFPEVYAKLMELGKKYDIWGFPRLTVFDGFVMKSQVMCSQTWAFVNDNDLHWVEQINKCKAEFREWFGTKGGTFQGKLPPMVPDYCWTNQSGTHDLLKSIKKMLDPKNILSPGTFE